jgi:hypothetical protein
MSEVVLNVGRRGVVLVLVGLNEKTNFGVVMMCSQIVCITLVFACKASCGRWQQFFLGEGHGRGEFLNRKILAVQIYKMRVHESFILHILLR